MDRLKVRRQPEKALQTRIRHELTRRGWILLGKTHGGRYQRGWPDLYFAHRVHGARWLEVKTPRGRLTRAQGQIFSRFERAGIGIWIATSIEGIHELLLGEPNWRDWYRPPKESLKDILK